MRVIKSKSKKRTRYNFTNNEIENIARVMKQKKGLPLNTGNSLFHVEFLRNNIHFQHDEAIYKINVDRDNMQTLPDFLDSVKQMFQYFINVAQFMSTSDNDKVRFYISKAPRTPFSTAILNVKDLNVEFFYNIFEKHMQSGAEEVLNHGWSSTVSVFVFPTGSAFGQSTLKRKQAKMYKYLKKNISEKGAGKKSIKKHDRELHKGVFQICADNFLAKDSCFVLALLVGKSFLDDDRISQQLKLKPNTSLNVFYTNADILNVYKAANVEVGGVKVNDLDKFHSGYLTAFDIDLVVFSKRFFDNIVYDSRTDNNNCLQRINPRTIFLWLNDNHYDLVLSTKNFHHSRFCIKCMKYRKQGETDNEHTCIIPQTCQRCYTGNRCLNNKDFKIKCTQCGILFYNRICFQNHLFNKIFASDGRVKGKITPCQLYFFCETCYRITRRFRYVKKGKTVQHDCNKLFCTHCRKQVKKDHQCFIKPAKIAINAEKPTLYFYDFETKTDLNGFMIPFYCVVQKVCIHCDKIDFVKEGENFVPHDTELFCDASIKPVECCGHRQYVFEKGNESITSDLVNFMLEQPKNSVWVAHNGGRFDSIFLLRELLVKKQIIPDLVMNGNKIISLEIVERGLKVIDSFLFLSMRLANFPKALGIANLTKGYHPYFFYDLNYVGPMVSIEYFNPPSKGSKDRLLFDTWYNEQCQKTYVFRNAIYYYCRMDVDILRRGCITFAYLIKEISSILPFYDKTCNTIASLALKIYSACFLKKNTIGQIPAVGYSGVKQSIHGLCWLDQIEKDLNESGNSLESALSARGEKVILKHSVDGFCPETNTIYQFHGCFYHGCPKCFDHEDYNVVVDRKFFVLHDRTQRITKEFEDFGYNVVEKWECDFKNETKLTLDEISDKKMKYYEAVRLNVRDALYGGRTSPACLYYAIKNGEKIRYIDFTSLYPFVQKKYDFPTGHPHITTGTEACANTDIHNVFGIVKCMVLPPKSLLFPVLPVRINKLLFPLCYLCAKFRSEKCDHSDNERAIFGTWCSIELQKAIEHGYKIVKVYEIYHYPTRDKIFSNYVNTFMKIKQESSGYPKTCYKEGALDTELIKKYIEEYANHEGVTLDKDNIEYNPGKRTVMKALLNSLWGKLAQNEDFTVVSFIDDFYKLQQLVSDNTIEVTSLDFIDKNFARTTHRKTSEALTVLKNRNVIIASFVTAYARLELFEVINKLGKNVLYYDTDSVIYVDKGKDAIDTGNYLGDLTNELEKEGCSKIWIEQFCSTGPKSYSYQTNVYEKTDSKGNVTNEQDKVVRVKGFSLRGEGKKKITFESINSCVQDKKKVIEIEYKQSISRDIMQNVFVEDQTKKFQFTFDKRIVLKDFFTVPYGYE